MIESLGRIDQVPSKVEHPPTLARVKEEKCFGEAGVPEQAENGSRQRQHAAAPEEAHEPKLLRGGSPSDPFLIQLRRRNGSEGNRGQAKKNEGRIGAEADPLQHSQQKQMRLEIDGRRAVARVRVAVKEMEPVFEMLTRVGHIVGEIVGDEGRGDLAFRPRSRGGPDQRNPGRQAQEQRDGQRYGRRRRARC